MCDICAFARTDTIENASLRTHHDSSAAMIAINTGLVMVLIRMPSRAKVRPTL